MQLTPLLAHLGAEGNPWLGILVVSAAVVAVVFVMAAFDRLVLESAGDLLLPMAAVILLAGLGGTLGDAAADQAPWVLPAGAVLLLAVVLAAVTQLELRLDRPLGYGALAVAALAALALRPTLETTFFPPALALPQTDDATVAMEVVEGPDADGLVTLRVSVTGGTLGPGPADSQPDDVEQGMLPRFIAGPAFVRPVDGPTDCAAGCATTTYVLQLPETADGALPTRAQVELLTATQVPFAPPLTASVELPADAG